MTPSIQRQALMSYKRRTYLGSLAVVSIWLVLSRGSYSCLTDFGVRTQRSAESSLIPSHNRAIRSGLKLPAPPEPITDDCPLLHDSDVRLVQSAIPVRSWCPQEGPWQTDNVSVQIPGETGEKRPEHNGGKLAIGPRTEVWLFHALAATGRLPIFRRKMERCGTA